MFLLPLRIGFESVVATISASARTGVLRSRQWRCVRRVSWRPRKAIEARPRAQRRARVRIGIARAALRLAIHDQDAHATGLVDEVAGDAVAGKRNDAPGSKFIDSSLGRNGVARLWFKPIARRLASTKRMCGQEAPAGPSSALGARAPLGTLRRVQPSGTRGATSVQSAPSSTRSVVRDGACGSGSKSKARVASARWFS